MKDDEFKEWIGGFFDASGSVCFSRSKSGYSLMISISKNENVILDKINEFYNNIFKMYSIDRNGKIDYNLRIGGKKSLSLLTDLEKFSVLKSNQIKKAIEFIGYIGDLSKSEERKVISNEVSFMNKNTLDFQWQKPYEKITYIYLAGMFDGNGYAGIYDNGLNVHISQKKYPAFLEYVSTIYEGSKCDGAKMNIYGTKNKFDFLSSIKKYVICKKIQVDKLLEYMVSDTSKKKKLKLQIKLLKKIDIESRKKYIEDIFIDLYENYTTEELILYNKYQQICNLKTKIDYKKDIYINTSSLAEKMNIDIELIFCETEEQNDIWMYYRNSFSSLDYRGFVGRLIKVLVRDTISNKYIGIFSLSSDFYSLSKRDEYLKGKGYERGVCERNTANISCCVPLQPFGWNCNGGKLLVKLAFSKEVKNYWENKYGDALLGLTTTSINGKSIQYDRLKELKFLGLTKGHSAYHIPRDVITACMILYDSLGLVSTRGGVTDKLKILFRDIKLPLNYLSHHKQKGIYFGFYEKEPANIEQLVEDWYNRWCKKRCQTHNKTETYIYTKDSAIFKNTKMYLFPKLKK